MSSICQSYRVINFYQFFLLVRIFIPFKNNPNLLLIDPGSIEFPKIFFRLNAPKLKYTRRLKLFSISSPNGGEGDFLFRREREILKKFIKRYETASRKSTFDFLHAMFTTCFPRPIFPFFVDTSMRLSGFSVVDLEIFRAEANGGRSGEWSNKTAGRNRSSRNRNEIEGLARIQRSSVEENIYIYTRVELCVYGNFSKERRR